MLNLFSSRLVSSPLLSCGAGCTVNSWLFQGYLHLVYLSVGAKTFSAHFLTPCCFQMERFWQQTSGLFGGSTLFSSYMMSPVLTSAAGLSECWLTNCFQRASYLTEVWRRQMNIHPCSWKHTDHIRRALMFKGLFLHVLTVLSCLMKKQI